MSEVFEIQVLTKKLIKIENLLQMANLCHVNLVSIRAMDGWDYSNEQTVNINQLDTINSIISKNKILVIEGEINLIQCGCFISSSKINGYEYDFWISTNYNTGLSVNYISDKNFVMYKKILETLEEYVIDDNFLICAMGVEISIFESNNINEIISKSSGVVRWILPKNQKIKLNQYIEELNKKVKIYSIY